MSLRPRLLLPKRKPPQRVARSKPVPPEEVVEELLLRHRQTTPFPVAPDDFLASLIPGQIATEAHQQAIENLAKTVNIRTEGELIHVSIGADFDSSYDTFFWVRAGKSSPAPFTPMDPFILWETHPHFKAVCAWHLDAIKLEQRLSEALQTAKTFFDIVSTAVELRATWPEMQKFVRLPGPLMAHLTAMRRAELETFMREEVGARKRKHVIDLLTAATLLEPRQSAAWVGLMES